MSIRLYYGHPRSNAGPDYDLTTEDLPPDGDFYDPHPVQGIRLTREPGARHYTFLLISVDIDIDESVLATHRLAWDQEDESYDLPEALVNASRRRWVRDEETTVGLMLSHDEDDDAEESDGEDSEQ